MSFWTDSACLHRIEITCAQRCWAAKSRSRKRSNSSGGVASVAAPNVVSNSRMFGRTSATLVVSYSPSNRGLAAAISRFFRNVPPVVSIASSVNQGGAMPRAANYPDLISSTVIGYEPTALPGRLTIVKGQLRKGPADEYSVGPRTTRTRHTRRNGRPFEARNE